ncbi:MAG: hypothetical protein ACLFUG_11755 [Nitriliruptoraceae bacterium]
MIRRVLFEREASAELEEAALWYEAQRSGSQATIETLSENPLWDSLTAVQEDQVYSVGGHFFSGGVLAANLVLDDLERFVLSEQG